MQGGFEFWTFGLVRRVERQIIATSAEVTLNGGLVRESPKNPINSGLGIIVICPDIVIETHPNRKEKH